MQFKHAVLQAIVAGEVTIAFRRWLRPTVKEGSRLRTAKGVVEVESVEAIALSAVTQDDVIRAGYETRQALLGDLRAGDHRTLYRIRLRFDGADERIALREADVMDAVTQEQLIAQLRRLDAVAKGRPWTKALLMLIQQRPEVAAAELAAALDQPKAALKANVRKLKELGLTESLDVGYRLSPRGLALLNALH